MAKRQFITGSEMGRAPPTAARCDRHVHDRLPDSFALPRSESEWLLTLLSADELRFIFEGPADDQDPN